MDFPRLALRDHDPFKYWSSLYREVWGRLHEQKAVLDREFQYALEPKGFPPIDVNEVVDKRFGHPGRIRRIDRAIPELSTSLTFWVIPSSYDSDRTAHDEIIERKTQLHITRTRIQDKLGNAMVEMVHLASHGTRLTYSRKLTQVKDWNGQKLTSEEGEIDIVLLSLEKGNVYGIEAKNVAQIIDSTYAKKKLFKHIRNCTKLGMTPTFIVSRVFSTTAEELEREGAIVIEAQAQYYQPKYWRIARLLKEEFGYHFVRKMGHPVSVRQLSRRLLEKLE